MALETENEKKLAKALDTIISSWHWNSAWNPSKVAKSSFPKRIQEAQRLLKELKEGE